MFSFKGEKPRFCLAHKLDGMQDSRLNAESRGRARGAAASRPSQVAAAQPRMYGGGGGGQGYGGGGQGHGRAGVGNGKGAAGGGHMGGGMDGDMMFAGGANGEGLGHGGGGGGGGGPGMSRPKTELGAWASAVFGADGRDGNGAGSLDSSRPSSAGMAWAGPISENKGIPYSYPVFGTKVVHRDDISELTAQLVVVQEEVLHNT